MIHSSQALAGDAPILDVDPFSPENLASPFALHRLLRDTAPVVYVPRYEMYAVGRFAEVRTVLSDQDRFTSTGGIGLADIRKAGAWRSPSPITEVDAPLHSARRNALQRILSPKLVQSWKESVSDVADAIVSAAVAKEDIDGIADLVEPFILQAFPSLVGIQLPARHFLEIGEMNFNQLGPHNKLTKASETRIAPLLAEYDRALRRESVTGGGIAERIYQAEDARDLESGTGGLHVRSFVRAGVDTTIAGIGHTLHLLAHHPGQWEKLCAEPTKIRRAFEEAIRLQSPSQIMWRTTVGKVELAGFQLRPDVKIGAFLGAANRDTEKYQNPDEFNVDREAVQDHLAFGRGRHICLGQTIARAEAEALLLALRRHASAFSLRGAPTYKPVNTLRTLKTLPLNLVGRRQNLDAGA